MNRIIKTTAIVLSSGLIATGVADSVSLFTSTSNTVSAAAQGKKKNIIHDPDSGEEIGSIDDIKGVAFIDSILESSTILKTKLHNRTNVDLAKSFSTILESATKQSTYREKLNVDESMVTSLQSETPLKVGDYAITTID